MDYAGNEINLTLADVEAMDALTLTPAQVGSVLGMHPNTIRWQARENPTALGFPVIVIKSRVRIPRIPFLRFMSGDLPSADTAARGVACND